jgi:hypothetical protein
MSGYRKADTSMRASRMINATSFQSASNITGAFSGARFSSYPRFLSSDTVRLNNMSADVFVVFVEL